MDTASFMSLLKEPKILGAAVTMPHKRTIIPYLDEITPECKSIGAYNTIFKRGTRADVISCAVQIRPASAFVRHFSGIFLPLKKYMRADQALLLELEGRSAVFALSTWLKCEPIFTVNRDDGEVEELISECRVAGFTGKLLHVKGEREIGNMEDPGAVVSCIPDFSPVSTGELVARKLTELILNKKHRGAFLEMCYHPLLTHIARFAKNLNWQGILGTEIMAWQALEQD